MTCRLYIGVDDGHGIDAAFFRDQVSPEHALDVLTRCLSVNNGECAG